MTALSAVAKKTMLQCLPAQDDCAASASAIVDVVVTMGALART